LHPTSMQLPRFLDCLVCIQSRVCRGRVEVLAKYLVYLDLGSGNFTPVAESKEGGCRVRREAEKTSLPITQT
jgi:hypothetical protein